MKLIWLIWVNIKRLIKNPQIILMLLVLPAVMVVFVMTQSVTGTDSKPTMAILNMDNSSESTKFIDKLKEEYEVQVITNGEEEIEGLVKDGEYTEIYIINKNFGESIKNKEKPSIKEIYSQEGTSTIVKRVTIDKAVDELLTGVETSKLISSEIEINNEENDSQIIAMVLMISYFMFISGGVVAEDLIKLKNTNIIKRSITTANSDMEILGGIFIAIFILQSLCTSLVFIVISKILGITVDILPQIVGVIVLSSIITTSITMAAVRWVKNSTVAELIIVVYGLINFMLSILSVNLGFLGEVPSELVNLSKISPFYWMSNILGGKDILISIVIILLMSVCFFTAGSFKVRDFARD